ncbi:MAG: phosphoenolpyruvate--protein phosphotransferase [Desulfovibrio sp.]|nr:phosphoenolpyruvate--protein phosphotransferase [Desulfovibrio sp.]
MARVILHGSPLSPGIAIGTLNLLPDTHLCDKRPISEAEVDAEIEALETASASASARLKATASSIPAHLAEYREIVELQMELVRDPRVLNGAKGRIRHKKICASWAVSETIAELAALFESMADPCLSERGQDIRNIGQRLLGALAGDSSTHASDSPCILASYALSAANIMEFSPDNVIGMVTVEGGVTSHVAILARSLKIPAVGGVGELFREARNGETIILDGLAGEALIGPDESEIRRFKARRESYAQFETEARQSASLPAITRDGYDASVLANLDRPQEAHELSRCGAEGVGLYRTEFGWLRENLPDEEALTQEYSSIVNAARGKPVVFRALDVGADKILPAHEALHEPNPALGLRGIRFCLAYPDIFRIQLRAFLRAGSHGPIKILLPMVTGIGEVRQTRVLIEQSVSDLERQGTPHVANPPLGIMVETPAAALLCPELAAECDFLSLGTNDLLHYLMAIDRNNRHVSYLHDPLHPAFLRVIREITQACSERGKPVSVCGELAADPLGTAILLGLGIRTFSATPRFVPAIKHTLRKLDYRSCRQIANAALAGAASADTRLRLHKTLARCMESRHFIHNGLITGAPPQ